MEKDFLAVAGAVAGFIAAILSVTDKMLALAERARSAKAAPSWLAPEEADDLDDDRKPAEPEPATMGPRRRRWWTIHWPDWLGPAPAYLIPNELAVVFGAGLLLNALGLLVSLRLESLLFLDMVGTAFAAILLGPWWGAAIALLTNALVNWLLYPQHDPDLLIFPWALVNMAGGFYWGVLARTGWFRGYLRSGHASVVSHITFLVLFGALGACVMGLPGALTQQVVSQTTSMTLNPTIVASLQDLIESWQDLMADLLGTLPSEETTEGLVSLLLAWIHSCLLYLPDKVVSVAIAMTLVKLGFPVFEEELVTGRPDAQPPADNRLAPLALGLLYAPVFAVLISAEAYVGERYWPLWAAPWLFVFAGYVWLKHRGPSEEDLRDARIDRAARYREDIRPIQRRPAASFCQRLTIGWLMAGALFALFMPVMLEDYSSVALNFFFLLYGSMLGLHLVRVSIAQNVAAASGRDAMTALSPRGRRRRAQAA